MQRLLRYWFLLLFLPLVPARAQNVGIGTPSPTQTLDVNGSLRVRGLGSADKRLLQTQPDGTLQLGGALPATTAPDQLAPGAVVATTGSPAGLAISGGYLYASLRVPNTLAVYSLSNPAQPALVAMVNTSITNVDAVAVGGGYLYMCSNGTNQLEIFSLATPTAPSSAAIVNLGYATDGAAVVGSLLYLSDVTNNRLHTLSLATPTAPSEVGFVAATGPGQLAVAGSYLYAALYSAGVVQTFSLATPTAPASQGTVPAAADANGAAVLGSRLYIGANSSNVLLTYDLATPTTPALLATQPQGGQPYALVGQGNYLYVASITANVIQVLPLTVPNVLGFDNSGNVTSVPAPSIGDNLGNHLASQSLALNGNWLSNSSGGSKGLKLTNDGFAQLGDKVVQTFGRLQLVNDASPLANADDVTLVSFSGASSGTPSLRFYGFRGSASSISAGTGATSSILRRNDAIGVLGFGGYINPNNLYSVSSMSAFYRGNGTAGSFASDLRFATSNVVQAVIDSLGYLGLGTVSPNSRLSLSPITIEPKITLWDGNNLTAHYGFGVSSYQLNYHVIDASANHVFWAGGKNGDGTELLRLTGYGYLGLGTNGTPAARLDVVADNLGGGGADDIMLRSYGAGSAPGIGQRRYRGTRAVPANVQNGDFLGEFGMSAYYNNSENNFTLSGITGIYQGNGTTPLSDLRLLSSGQERMRIDETGRVGIGVAPAYALDVAGTIHAATAQGVVLDAEDRPLITRNWHTFTSGNYSGLGRWGLFMEAASLTFGLPNLSNCQFQWVGYNLDSSIGSQLMSLNQNGNLGVGIANPSARLEVQGSGSGTGIARVRVRSTNDQAGVGLLSNNTGEVVMYSPSGTDDLRLYVGSADRLSVISTGQVGIGKEPATTEALDVEGAVRVGTASVVGEVHTPITGSANMLAVAYGQMSSGGASVYSSSGNFTLSSQGAGHCRLTFASGSGLNGTNFSALAVLVTQYGATPGSASFVGGVGFVDVYTFNAAGAAVNNDFSVVVFRP